MSKGRRAVRAGGRCGPGRRARAARRPCVDPTVAAGAAKRAEDERAHGCDVVDCLRACSPTKHARTYREGCRLWHSPGKGCEPTRFPVGAAPVQSRGPATSHKCARWQSRVGWAGGQAGKRQEAGTRGKRRGQKGNNICNSARGGKATSAVCERARKCRRRRLRMGGGCDAAVTRRGVHAQTDRRTDRQTDAHTHAHTARTRAHTLSNFDKHKHIHITHLRVGAVGQFHQRKGHAGSVEVLKPLVPTVLFVVNSRVCVHEFLLLRVHTWCAGTACA